MAAMVYVVKDTTDESRTMARSDSPDGKLWDDERAIDVAINRRVAPDGTKMVRVDFGRPVAWLSLRPEQAVQMAITLLHFAGRKDLVGDDSFEWPPPPLS
jgi:hypothetical protein